MKWVCRYLLNSGINVKKNHLFRGNFLKKYQKKYAENFLFKKSNINLTETKKIEVEKIHLNWNEINSKKNIEKFTNLFNFPLNLKDTGNFNVENTFLKYYPLKQNFFNSRLNKFEQFGTLYFSYLLLDLNKVYYEFKSSKNIIFPMVIPSNRSILCSTKKLPNLSNKIKRKNETFSIRNDFYGITATKENFTSFYQIYFSKKVAREILKNGFNFFKIFIRFKNEIYLNRIKLTSNFDLITKKDISSRLFKKIFLFEMEKGIKKTLKITYQFSVPMRTSSILLNNLNIPRLKLKISYLDKKSQNKVNFETFKYSKKMSSYFFSKNFNESIPCSILISHENIPQLNQILENVEFSRLSVTFYKIKDIKQLDFSALLELISDLKSTNQRIMLVICQAVDIKIFNFIFLISILPIYHCLKLFSGLKDFPPRIKKIFFVKKCLEKSLIFYPLSFSRYPDSNIDKDGSKFFNIEINSNFQNGFPKNIYEINITLLTKNAFFKKKYENYVLISDFTEKTLKGKNVNLCPMLMFYYINLIIFLEILIVKKLFQKKRIEQILLYQLFLYLGDIRKEIYPKKTIFDLDSKNMLINKIIYISENYKLE